MGGHCLNPKLFEVDGVQFKRVVGEVLYFNGRSFESIAWDKRADAYDVPHDTVLIDIYHFMPSLRVWRQKEKDFYAKMKGCDNAYNFSMYGDGPGMKFLLWVGDLIERRKAPHRLSLNELPYYAELREYNPKRELYR